MLIGHYNLDYFRLKSSTVQQMRPANDLQRNNIQNQTAPSSPKHNRNVNGRQQSQIIASNNNNNSIIPPANHYGFTAEKAERRKYRVEKKLQEMQQINESEREREAIRDDTHFDIIEFAENNFNTHERTPEGTIMATLTRKGKKPVDVATKQEMVTYYRGNSIPTSHIHMYDPENVTVACNVFKVYFKNEIKYSWLQFKQL